MSLMRLLAATRSIVNIRDRRSPYEMRRQNLLPKFGQPPRADAKAEGPPAAVAELDEEGNSGAGTGVSAASPQTQPQESNERSHMKTNSISGQNQEEAPGSPTPESAVRAAFPHGLWTWFRSSATALLPPEQRAVQGDLALDTLKVVRNDLNEADLEVVAVRKAVAAAAAGAAKQEKAPGGRRVLWGICEQ